MEKKNGGAWYWLMLAAVCSAEKWRFPDTAASVRVDDKVTFNVSPFTGNQNEPPKRKALKKNDQSDGQYFGRPSERQGFYDQPSDAGRFTGNVRPNELDRYLSKNHVPNNYNYPASIPQEKPVYESDGTLDSLQVCTCSPTLQNDCRKRVGGSRACGPNMHLCCKPDRVQQPSAEYFSDLTDERPMLLPGRGPSGGPFPPPPDSVLSGQYGPGHAHEAAIVSGLVPERAQLSSILVGPQGPKGFFGPVPQANTPPVLVGPDGPTGITGPTDKTTFPDYGSNRSPYDGAVTDNYSGRPVLVGPGGPTGLIGPNKPSALGPEGSAGVVRPNRRPSDSYNGKPVLVGPEGPTGTIGPNYEGGLGSYKDPEEARPSETAQRPVLVGPGGPTGIIGPGYNQRPILVGPGGPTGIIGPRRPVLVGPGGPTGIIGPGYGLTSRQGARRPVLVGPGGPTGTIGPYGYYGK
ncbi:unnamed protein product, partial [Iphiclides podalirius]